MAITEYCWKDDVLSDQPPYPTEGRLGGGNLAFTGSFGVSMGISRRPLNYQCKKSIEHSSHKNNSPEAKHGPATIIVSITYGPLCQTSRYVPVIFMRFLHIIVFVLINQSLVSHSKPSRPVNVYILRSCMHIHNMLERPKPCY